MNNMAIADLIDDLGGKYYDRGCQWLVKLDEKGEGGVFLRKLAIRILNGEKEERALFEMLKELND